MEFDDPFTRSIREAQRHLDLLQGPVLDHLATSQAINQALQESIIDRHLRETRAHEQLLELVNGPQWFRDAQLVSQHFRAGIGQVMDGARIQMQLLQDSNAMTFVREAQSLARQFHDFDIMRTIRDAEAQRQITDAASEYGPAWRSVRDFLAEPAVMTMLREVTDQAALHRRLGLDAISMAGMLPLSAMDSFESATAELRAIEAGMAVVGAQHDTAAVLIGFQRIIETLSGLLERAGSPIERRTILKFLEWVIPIVLMLFLAYISHLDGVDTQIDADKNAQIAHQDSLAVQKSIEGLVEEMGQARSRPDGANYYEVKRLTPLCSTKHFHGNNYFVLIPGAEVEALERSGKWVRVCAIAPQHGTTEGWVLKKYLRRQKR